MTPARSSGATAFEQRFGRNLPAPLLLAPPAHRAKHIAIGEGWFAVIVRLRTTAHSTKRTAWKELLDIAQEFGRVGLWERDLATGQGAGIATCSHSGARPSQGTPGFTPRQSTSARRITSRAPARTP